MMRKDISKINRELDGEYKVKVFKTLERIKIIKDSLRIIDFLNEKNIDYVVFKGITLHQFNKERYFYDLDIFVKKNDVKKTIRLLADKFGYEPNQPEMKQFDYGQGFHVALHNPKMITVEIHYYLWDCSYVDEEVIPILSSKKQVKIKDTIVPCLSDEMQLMEAIMHNAYNHGFIADHEGWFRDIEATIKNNDIDWKMFLKIIHRLDNQEMVYRTISLIELFCYKKISVPEDVRESLHKRSRKLRLFLTRGLDKKFYDSYIKIKKLMISSGRRWHNWRLKCVLRFTFGLNRQFFKILTYYIWSFKLQGFRFFPPQIIIRERFGTRMKAPIIYFYYIPNVPLAVKEIIEEYKETKRRKPVSAI